MEDAEILMELTRLYETTPNPANAKIIEKMIAVLNDEYERRQIDPDLWPRDQVDGGS